MKWHDFQVKVHKKEKKNMKRQLLVGPTGKQHGEQDLEAYSSYSENKLNSFMNVWVQAGKIKGRKYIINKNIKQIFKTKHENIIENQTEQPTAEAYSDLNNFSLYVNKECYTAESSSMDGFLFAQYIHVNLWKVLKYTLSVFHQLKILI